MPFINFPELGTPHTFGTHLQLAFAGLERSIRNSLAETWRQTEIDLNGGCPHHEHWAVWDGFFDVLICKGCKWYITYEDVVLGSNCFLNNPMLFHNNPKKLNIALTKTLPGLFAKLINECGRPSVENVPEHLIDVIGYKARRKPKETNGV